MSISALLGMVFLAFSAVLLCLGYSSPQAASEHGHEPLAAGFTGSTIWNVVIDITVAVFVAITLVVALQG